MTIIDAHTLEQKPEEQICADLDSGPKFQLKAPSKKKPRGPPKSKKNVSKA